MTPSCPFDVFVFGSNLAGRHGKGAALEALRKHGAVIGKGQGHYGNSYAIPTKDFNLRTRSLDEISQSIRQFISYAHENPQFRFLVTRVGCGLAGYSDSDISPMFVNAPLNCILPDGWRIK